MASWLKNFLKPTKPLPDSYSGLVHLHTTKKITHIFNLHKKPKKNRMFGFTKKICKNSSYCNEIPVTNPLLVKYFA